MHLYDLTALSDVDLTSRATAFLVAHPLRTTDEAALDAHSASRTAALASEVFHSERVWVITDDVHRPIAMLGLRRFGGEDGLMWSVVHPSRATPSDELRDAVAPALAEIAALRPRLWAWKAPQDRPEALPRLDRDAGDDLTLIGPEPSFDSSAWIEWFQDECFDLTRAAPSTCAE